MAMPTYFQCRALAMGLALLGGVSCASGPRSPASHTAVKRSPRLIDPLAVPRLLAREFSEPEGALEHTFIWSSEGMDWRMKILNPSLRAAGIALARPVDLADRRHDMHLTFLLHPASAAGRLVLELEGADPSPALYHRASTLDAYRAGSLREWEIISIPLDEFAARLDDAEPSREGAEIDLWPAIAGIRFNLLEGGDLPPEIAVRNLRFRVRGGFRR